MLFFTLFSFTHFILRLYVILLCVFTPRLCFLFMPLSFCLLSFWVGTFLWHGFIWKTDFSFYSFDLFSYEMSPLESHRICWYQEIIFLFIYSCFFHASYLFHRAVRILRRSEKFGQLLCASRCPSACCFTLFCTYNAGSLFVDIVWFLNK